MGREFLALIEGEPLAKVFITNVVEKLVFQDEQGNVISKTDGILLGKIVWRQISRSDTTFG